MGGLLKAFLQCFHGNLLRRFPTICLLVLTLCMASSRKVSGLVCVTNTIRKKWQHVLLRLGHKRQCGFCISSSLNQMLWEVPASTSWRYSARWRVLDSEKMKVPCPQPALTCQACARAILEVDPSAVKTQMTVASFDILTTTSWDPEPEMHS